MIEKDDAVYWFKLAMNKIATFAKYNWSGDFIISESKEFLNKFKEYFEKEKIDILKISIEDLEMLGFSKWDENELMLIPLWCFDLIPDGTELISISGDKKIKGKDEIDLDIRLRRTAYGFYPKIEHLKTL